MTKKPFSRIQNTAETCLPICLMTLLDHKSIEVKDTEEMNILINGLKMTRLDYALGQLKYVVEKYGVSMDAVIENTLFYNELSKLKHPSELKLENKKVDKKLITDITSRTNPIVYIDRFYLGGDYHYPHFVIVTSFNNNKTRIFDPWIGGEMLVNTKRFIRAVQGLRNHLKLSPKLIFII